MVNSEDEEINEYKNVKSVMLRKNLKIRLNIILGTERGQRKVMINPKIKPINNKRAQELSY